MTLDSLFKLLWLVMLSLLITGCEMHRDSQLWSIGVLVYALYLMALLLTFLVPALHQNRYFRRLIEAMKKPAVVLAVMLMIAGFVIIIFGVLIHEKALTYHLIPLAGGVVVVLGQCLRMWAISKSTERQTVYAKAIAISVGCIIGLTYIINGAELLKF